MRISCNESLYKVGPSYGPVGLDWIGFYPNSISQTDLNFQGNYHPRKFPRRKISTRVKRSKVQTAAAVAQTRPQVCCRLRRRSKRHLSRKRVTGFSTLRRARISRIRFTITKETREANTRRIIRRLRSGATLLAQISAAIAIITTIIP